MNTFAAVYTLLTVILTFFPPSVPITPETMSWCFAVYIGVVILGVIHHFLLGQKECVDPSKQIEIEH